MTAIYRVMFVETFRLTMLCSSIETDVFSLITILHPLNIFE